MIKEKGEGYVIRYNISKDNGEGMRDKGSSNTVINKNQKELLRSKLSSVTVELPEDIYENCKWLDKRGSTTLLSKLLNHDINQLQRYEYDYIEYRVYELLLSKRLYLEGIGFRVIKRQQKESVDTILFVWNNIEYIINLLEYIKCKRFKKVDIKKRCTSPKEIYKVYISNEYEILDRLSDGDRVVDILHSLGVPYISREWMRFSKYVKESDREQLEEELMLTN